MQYVPNRTEQAHTLFHTLLPLDALFVQIMAGVASYRLEDTMSTHNALRTHASHRVRSLLLSVQA